MTFRPILAADLKGQYKELRFPLLCTPKIDGIRCVTPADWTPLSRSLKPIPNRHLQALFHEHALALRGMDGELILGNDDNRNSFSETSSAIMSHAGDPQFTYVVFDVLPHIHSPLDKFEVWKYRDRVKYLEEWRATNIEHWPDWAQLLLPVEVKDLDQLNAFETDCVEVMGYEGICMRSPYGKYKYGRSTIREQHLVKCKRFVDSEATIISVEPLIRNVSGGFKDARGYTVHTHRTCDRVADQLLGSFVVEDNDFFPQLRFGVGSGFGDQERYEYWRDRAKLTGRTIKYKYFPTGTKMLPRHPIFLGFRED